MKRRRASYIFVSGFILLLPFCLSVKGYTDTLISTNPPGVGGSRYAEMSSDDSGNVYVEWMDTRNGRSDIYFNYSSDYGVTWQATDIRLDTGDPPGASSSYANEISCDDSGHVYVTWADNRNGNFSDIYFNYSSDYGATWQATAIRLDTGDPPGSSFSNIPQISHDGTGHVYVAWQEDERNIYFNYSSDYGATWQTTAIRLDTDESPNAYHSYGHKISSDDSGHVYVIWERLRNTYLVYSSDYGVTWQTGDLRLDSSPDGSPDGNSQISSDGRGSVYVTWRAVRNGRKDIYFNYSRDYGATWQASDIRLNDTRTNHFLNPNMSIDGSGHVYVTWMRGGSVRSDISFNYSDDYGVTWQKCDISLGVGYYPEIISDDSGYVYVRWTAWRNGSRDIYFNYSHDYGATWQATDNWLIEDDGDNSTSWKPQIGSDGNWNIYVTWSGGGIYFNSVDTPCSPESYEPDDNSSQAATIVLGTSQTHNICPIGDVDWVTFTLTSESGVVLETSGKSSDTQMWLYDSSLNEIEFDDNGGTGNFSRIDRLCGTDSLPVGTYYVKIEESGNDYEIFSYDISLTETSSCLYSISSTSNSFVSFGGDGIINLTTTGGCPWTSVSNADWIEITSGSSGCGNGTVGYSVLSNPDTRPRTGTITIAGNTFTITQNGDGRNEIIMDFGSAGIWIRWDSGTWTKLHSLSAGIITTSDIDGNGRDEIIMDFGSSGIWIRMDSGAWCKLHSQSAGIITTGDLDGNGRDEIVMDFGSAGIWIRWDSGTWTKLHSQSAGIITTGDLDGNGKDEIIMDFDSFGIWIRWVSGSWTKLHSLSARDITTGDIDGNGKDEIIMDFDSSGIWTRMDSGAWEKLHSLSSEIITIGDIDGNGKDEIIMDFGSSGIWIRMDSGTWGKLHTLSAEIITIGDIDGNGRDEIIMDFGAGTGIWIRWDSGTWTKLHSQSPRIITTGNIDGN